jgi:hypothetical protein
MFRKNLSLAEKFRKFLENLQIPDETAMNRQFKKIAAKINSDYWNLRSDSRNTYYIGSYGRGTAIKGNSNINIMVVLPPAEFKRIDEYEGNGQFILLRELKEKLLDIFPDTFMKEDEKGEVMVPLSKGIITEVIPAFASNKGNYLYPNISHFGSWNEFNPLREIEVINNLNYEYGGKVKHLARMMRAWKYTHQVHLPGMLLDTLVMDFMEEWEGKDKSYLFYGRMVLAFFEYLAGKRDEQELYYAKGSNRELQKEQPFGDSANNAYKKVLQTLHYEDVQDHKQANQGWREIFGSYFP